MIGPGKYDDVCTAAREESKAKGIVLVIYGGNHGNGFSVQAPTELAPELPGMLRDLADQIDHSLQNGEFLAPPAA